MSEAMTLYKVNNQYLYAREEGKGDKQVAILIHGWSSSWYALSPLMRYLTKRFHCVGIDLPGYGCSPRPKERITIKGYADLVATLIRKVSPDQQVILIGHSMGGMISLTIALHYPELVERLILLAPTVTGHLSLFVNLFIFPLTMLERFIPTDQLGFLFESPMNWVVDQLMRPASLAMNSGMTQADYERLRADARRPGQGRVRAECFWAMRYGDLRGKLWKIAAPSLIIWGLEDNTISLRDASVISYELPDADMRFMPNVNHWPQFEAPDRTQRFIEGFLGRPIKLLQMEF